MLFHTHGGIHYPHALQQGFCLPPLPLQIRVILRRRRSLLPPIQLQQEMRQNERERERITQTQKSNHYKSLRPQLTSFFLRSSSFLFFSSLIWASRCFFLSNSAFSSLLSDILQTERETHTFKSYECICQESPEMLTCYICLLLLLFLILQERALVVIQGISHT